MTKKEALDFVKRQGIVLQAARGPVPSLAEAIAGGPIHGSWWGHPKGKEIFRASSAIVESGEVLVCKLVDGKITYVHRRLWPALVRLAPRFAKAQLTRVWSEHTPTGAHKTLRKAFPAWVPREILEASRTLSQQDAERQLSAWLHLGKRRRG